MFGDSLRKRRLRAGLGLRTFAGLIDQRASTVSAIESCRRPPWRDAALQKRIAQVLGDAELHPAQQINGEAAVEIGTSDSDSVHEPGHVSSWWSSEAAALPHLDVAALEDFLQLQPVNVADSTAKQEPHWPHRTELAIEWEVGKLLGKQSRQLSAAPVDVEAKLESRTAIRLEVVPGLIPHFSVEACLAEQQEATILYVDRIVADSRPMASYRQLLAKCAALHILSDRATETRSADLFRKLQQSDYWPRVERDCERFALALMLPATPVLGAGEAVYRELVLNEGWVELEVAARTIRNRLAEQFAVPPALVQRRLMGWPCHLYGRVAQALAAEELTLPPTDWLFEARPQVQQRLFDCEPT